MSRTEVETVLAAFLAAKGMPETALDENGVIALQYGDLELALAHLPPFPGVKASARLPDGLARREDLANELLRANLSWSATGGGTFGKLPDQHGFVVSRMIPMIDDHQAFERDLTAFAELALDWVERIKHALAAPKEEQDRRADQGNAQARRGPPGPFIDYA
ncbi:MAG: type III secretion system chaperone [Pseudomonadota bacterium]